MGKITINGKDITQPFEYMGKKVKEVFYNGHTLTFGYKFDNNTPEDDQLIKYGVKYQSVGVGFYRPWPNRFDAGRLYDTRTSAKGWQNFTYNKILDTSLAPLEFDAFVLGDSRKTVSFKVGMATRDASLKDGINPTADWSAQTDYCEVEMEVRHKQGTSDLECRIVGHKPGTTKIHTVSWVNNNNGNWVIFQNDSSIGGFMRLCETEGSDATGGWLIYKTGNKVYLRPNSQGNDWKHIGVMMDIRDVEVK